MLNVALNLYGDWFRRKISIIRIHKNPIPPQEPPSLREAVRMIATLGGFLGRKGDVEPGMKTIWRSRSVSKRGLRRLHDITATWKLVHQISWFMVDDL